MFAAPTTKLTPLFKMSHLDSRRHLKFPRFLDLPSEIRQMIWYASFPGPRVIQVQIQLKESCPLNPLLEGPFISARSLIATAILHRYFILAANLAKHCFFSCHHGPESKTDILLPNRDTLQFIGFEKLYEYLLFHSLRPQNITTLFPNNL